MLRMKPAANPHAARQLFEQRERIIHQTAAAEAVQVRVSRPIPNKFVARTTLIQGDTLQDPPVDEQIQCAVQRGAGRPATLAGKRKQEIFDAKMAPQVLNAIQNHFAFPSAACPDTRCHLIES
jgi:replication fork clamp-binding protein CrfC